MGRSGLRVSTLGLGTMGWGTEVDDVAAAELFGAFRDAGGTLIDTAHGYGDGDSEKVLGSLTAGCRDDLVIATKAGISSTRDGLAVDTSRGTLLNQLDTSLRRLRTDHVDLWMVQAWSEQVPIHETASALTHAVSSGRARYLGVSNHNSWQLTRVASLLEAEGVPVIANEMEYSLVAREIEDGLLPAAAHLGVGVLAWAPLGGGVLTGKYRHGIPADSRAAGGRHGHWARRRVDSGSGSIVDAVATAAEGLRLTPVQVALSWVLDRPGISAALTGARSSAQLRMILASEEVRLPEQVRQALDEVSGQGDRLP